MALPKSIDVTVGEATKELRRLDLPDDRRVRIVLEPDNMESLSEIARRCREEAKRAGMTEEVFEDLMRDT
ncbi:MAG: hypothetical protein GVY13_04875 [Alphaproteobacteria bacterium]|jgi:predicted DNA-binding antitoxin AbrB/MazE fold protein|nr:hypothetical protein [Alphaproteobacteria bacterium]